MNDPSDRLARSELEDAKQMQVWVRRYAQNRSLAVALGLVVFLTLFLGISGASYWGRMAYRDGNAPLLAICVGVLILALAATVYLSVPGWGGRRLQQAAGALYAREGQVTIAAPRPKRPWLVATLGAGFFVCVLGSVLLGRLGYLPMGKYMQPVSAIYVVPFLIALNFLMRPAVGPMPLLWPLLYALHAALIVAGAPIVFAGAWEPLNMVVPTVGYGLLTSPACHLYSRWALHRVRTLGAQQLNAANRTSETDPT